MTEGVYNFLLLFIRLSHVIIPKKTATVVSGHVSFATPHFFPYLPHFHL